MDNLIKEELTEFVDNIEGFNKEKHPRKIIIFGYYLTHVINEPYFDQKMIRECYDLLDDSTPSNISDFLSKLKNSKKIIPRSPGYRLHRNEVQDLEILIKIKVSGNESNKKNTNQEVENAIKDSHEVIEKESTQPKTNSEEYFDEEKANKSLSLIKKLDTLQLSKFKVVGKYVRFDKDVRNHLKNMKQKIIEGLEPKSIGNENFFIWGPPGSGKSFFVQEVSRTFGDSVHYLEINLSKLKEDEFKTELNNLEKIEKHCICLIDEIDSESSGGWAYETLLNYLFPSKTRKFRICFILAGSGGTSMEEMKEKINSYNKGKDLINRVPPTNEYVISSFEIGDYLLVGASQLMSTIAIKYPEIKEIEKLYVSSFTPKSMVLNQKI